MLLAELQIQLFLSEHSPDDGWIVYYSYNETKIEGLFLMHLADYLQNSRPNTLKSCSLTREPSWKQIERIAFKSGAHEGSCELDTRGDLESDRWIGSVEIEWADSPIHFNSIFVQGRMAELPLVLIATKSVPALRDFLSVLAEYGRSREEGKRHEILVVNDTNSSFSIPTAGWDDVVLPLGMAEDIRGNIEAFFRSRDKYRVLGLPHRRGFLFAGPPGCGKTLTVKVLVSTVNAKVITVLARRNVSDEDIQRAFDLGRRCAPSMIILEELEKLVGGPYVSLGHFLNLLDGLSVTEGVLLVATSNDPAKLDLALLHRPSRFDRVWKFPLPDYEQRLALLRKRGREYFSDDVLSEVARNSSGFSMAYVQEIVVNALLQSANNGGKPDDRGLLESFDILKRQRRAASKSDERIETRATVGFAQELG